MRRKADYLHGGFNQLVVALGATASVSVLWHFVPMVLLPLAVSIALIALITAAIRPFTACLILILFALFKLDDAFPILAPLNIMFAFSAITIFALAWNVFCTRSVEPSWPPELKAFLVFFLIATLGVPFADSSRLLAFEEWSTYAKIAVLVPAVAWLPRTPKHFEAAARAFVIGGTLIGLLAIYNTYSGIGLVETSRAAIGTGFLANPNDLALLLLFPLSFAAALLIHRSGALTTAISVVGLPTITWAIILTQSRGGLLGVIAGLLFVGGQVVRSKLLLSSLAIGAAFALYAAMEIADRISGGTADVEQTSAMMRVSAWQAGINMAISSPLTGVGIGNFSTQYPYYAPDFTYLYLNAHSIWIQVLGEIGLPGFVAFLFMIVACFVASFKNLRYMIAAGAPSILPAFALALLVGLAAFCVSGSFANHAYNWQLYILLGFIAAISRFRPMEVATSSLARVSTV